MIGWKQPVGRYESIPILSYKQVTTRRKSLKIAGQHLPSGVAINFCGLQATGTLPSLLNHAQGYCKVELHIPLGVVPRQILIH